MLKHVALRVLLHARATSNVVIARTIKTGLSTHKLDHDQSFGFTAMIPTCQSPVWQ